MATPSVQLSFINGQLGQSTVPQDDGVFLLIGACTNGIPGQVTSIVQSNEIVPLLGYGAAAEMAAQVLSTNSNGCYVVPGVRTAGSIGSVSQSRTAAPAMTVVSLLGLPGTPFAAAFSNAGQGQIFFDPTSTPQLSSAYSAASVTITTAGGLGTAVATVVVGATTTTNVSLVSGTIASGVAGVSINAILPLSGTFVLGDVFNAVATPADNANLVVSILGVNSSGQAQFTYSLDGGVTVSDPVSAGMNSVTSFGLNQPSLTLSGTSPGGAYTSEILFTGIGTAQGIAAQCSVSTGVLVKAQASGSSLGAGTLTVSAVPASGADTWTVPLTIQATIVTPGAPGTATANFTINGVEQTASNPVPLSTSAFDPSDASYAIMLEATAAESFVANNTYTIVVQPQATYEVFVGGSIVGGTNYLASTGVVSISPVPNAVVTLAHTNTAIYSYSATNPALTTSYDLSFFANPSYNPLQNNGQPFGINLSFGYGLQQAGDTYAAAILGPTVGNTDVENALTAAQATAGIAYALVGIDANVPSFSRAGSLASAINAMLLTDAESQPSPAFDSALVCGPALPSSGAGSNSGSTTAAFVSATGSLDLERTYMGCGADYITSALTGRQDLRNGGVGYIARIAEVAVQQDPGAVADGALSNVVSTTTPANDAQTFLNNRGMTSVVYSGLGGASPTGVFCWRGLTLAGVGSDYGTVTNRRVADKVAKYAFSAFTPYINSKVATVPGKGTITALAAAQINANVQGQIQTNCSGNFQSVSVSVSTTANVLSTGIVPVTVTVVPFGYMVEIEIELGFSF